MAFALGFYILSLSRDAYHVTAESAQPRNRLKALDPLLLWVGSKHETNACTVRLTRNLMRASSLCTLEHCHAEGLPLADAK